MHSEVRRWISSAPSPIDPKPQGWVTLDLTRSAVKREQGAQKLRDWRGGRAKTAGP